MPEIMHVVTLSLGPKDARLSKVLTCIQYKATPASG